MESELVYSTVHGTMCPACNQPIANCLCYKNKPLPKTDGIVRIFRDTKGRKGKCVTVITGLPLSKEACSLLLQKLKKRCGSGGTVKDYTIEIQGDHREVLQKELAGLGYRVKLAGG
jgi:translation initiation factor 1